MLFAPQDRPPSRTVLRMAGLVIVCGTRKSAGRKEKFYEANALNMRSRYRD